MAKELRSFRQAVRVPVLLVCSAEEDRTQQAFKDECDINFLMKRYEKTGVVPLGRAAVPQYIDATAIDYQSSMDRVAAVRGVFSLLDARTRARFENDPEQMLEFLADPANKEEGIKLGLIPKDRGVVRGEEVVVPDAAGSGVVRPGAASGNVQGGDAGSGAPAVSAVGAAAPSGEAKPAGA